MKRAIIIAVAAIILSVPLASSAQTCSVTININSFPFALRQTAIRNALQNYSAYPAGDHYELCFIMDELTVGTDTLFTDSFKLKPLISETRDVYLVGLNIRNHSDNPVSIPILVADNKGAGKIILKDISLKDVRNGIQIAGNPSTKVVSSVVQGDASKSGTCVEIKADGAIVQGSEISGCGEGIVIEADGVLIGAADHEHFEADKNSIHDNVIGLHVVSGKRNKFGYNLIYDNKPSTAPDGLSTDAILIEAGANEGLLPLELVLFEADDGLEYALKCSKDENGTIVKREMFFSLPQDSGLLTLFQSDQNYHQMNRYLTKCDVGADGICVIGDLPEDVLEMIPEGECGIEDYRVTALFTGTSSSGLLANSQEMDGPVAFVANPYDIPTSGGVTDADLGSGSDEDYTEDSSGDGMGGDGAVAEGGSIVSAAGGAAGGCGGGASLAGDTFRTAVLFMDLWWNLLLVGLILGLRRAYVRAHNNRNHTRH